MKQEDLRDMFIDASKSVCTSTVVVSPDPLSPAPSNISAVKRLQKTEKRTLMTLNQQMKEISKWSTRLMNCTAQV
jgi:hypothetical protein